MIEERKGILLKRIHNDFKIYVAKIEKCADLFIPF